MYKCVTTTGEVREYLSSASAVGLDIETSPLEAFRNEEKAALDSHKAQITGISFSTGEDSGIYIPLCHKTGDNIDNPIEFWDYLAGFFKSHAMPIIIHNAAFESAFFYARGIVIQEPIYDSIIAAQMTLKSNTNFRKLADSGLKTLTPELLGINLPSFSEVTDGKHFDELDPQDSGTIRYACSDSDFALRLYFLFKAWHLKWMPKHHSLIESAESPTAVYVGMMKHNGIGIDRELMLVKKAECEERLKKLREEIAFIIGDINIGANASTSAFKQYLYKDLNLPVVKTTAKYAEAADEESFVLLRDRCKINRPELAELFDLILEYRRIGKLLSTYITGYLNHTNSATGRLHPQFFQLGAESGRFSCKNPNVQNQSSDKKINTRNFIKAGKGCVLVEADYAQIEAKLAAYLSGDPHLRDVFHSGKDLHAMTTAAVFQIPLSEASDKSHPQYKHRRTVAKATFFGFMYGMYGKTLQRNLKVSAGVNVTVDEAKSFLENLKRSYPVLTAWQKTTISKARSEMFAETALGRRRYVPDIRSDNFIKSGGAERSALNHPVQGLAADILKLSMARLVKTLPPYIRPLFTVHDSLVFEVPEERVKEAAALIKAAMEAPPPLEGFDIKLTADVSVGRTYGEMKELTS